MINIANQLNIDPNQVASVMTVNVDDPIKKGQIIADA